MSYLFELNTYREEHVDLFQSVRVVSNALEKHYSADALNIAIQDGKDAGQSVPHVHVHILPRKSGQQLPLKDNPSIVFEFSACILFKRRGLSKE